ncbi:MAG: hypothetical protein R2751_17860 [Bacteroidales bacterium]
MKKPNFEQNNKLAKPWEESQGDWVDEVVVKFAVTRATALQLTRNFPIPRHS